MVTKFAKKLKYDSNGECQLSPRVYLDSDNYLYMKTGTLIPFYELTNVIGSKWFNKVLSDSFYEFVHYQCTDSESLQDNKEVFVKIFRTFSAQQLNSYNVPYTVFYKLIFYYHDVILDVISDNLSTIIPNIEALLTRKFHTKIRFDKTEISLTESAEDAEYIQSAVEDNIDIINKLQDLVKNVINTYKKDFVKLHVDDGIVHTWEDLTNKNMAVNDSVKYDVRNLDIDIYSRDLPFIFVNDELHVGKTNADLHSNIISRINNEEDTLDTGAAYRNKRLQTAINNNNVALGHIAHNMAFIEQVLGNINNAHLKSALKDYGCDTIYEVYTDKGMLKRVAKRLIPSR